MLFGRYSFFRNLPKFSEPKTKSVFCSIPRTKMKVFSKTRGSLELCLLFFFIFLDIRTSSESKSQERSTSPVTTSSDSTMATAKGNLKVTLAIFSGRPDPEWQILTSDPNHAEIERLLNVARSGGFVYGFKDMPARLGYKGFLLRDATKENAEPELIIGPHTARLQQLLLKTVPENILSENLHSKISKAIGTGAETAEGQEATTSSDSTGTTTSTSTPGNLNVTLAIFSGRPDPEWQILTSDPNYAEIEQLLNVARSGGFVYGVEDMPARLGYKGFLVHDLANKNAEPELIIGPHTGKLQQLLLKTVPDNILSENLRSKISKEIGTGADTAEGQVAPTPSSESTDTSTSSGNLKVTLAIYSGRPDPEWQVLTSDPNYAEIKRLLDVARSGGLIKRHKDMPSRLGYKGFLVYDIRKKNAVPELIIGPHTVKLQQLLLKTIPEEVLSKDACTEISRWITSAAGTAGGI